MNRFLVLLVLLSGSISADDRAISDARIATHKTELEQKMYRRTLVRAGIIGVAGLFVAYRTYRFFSPGAEAIGELPLSTEEISRLHQIAASAINKEASLSLLQRFGGWSRDLGSAVTKQGMLTLSMMLLSDCYAGLKKVMLNKTSAYRFAQEETHLFSFLKELIRTVEQDKEKLLISQRSNAAKLVWHELEKVIAYCDLVVAQRKPDSLFYDRLSAYQAQLRSEAQNLADTLSRLTVADLFAYENSLTTILTTFSALESLR